MSHTRTPLNKLHCASCHSNELQLVMDFGDVALAGAFLKEKDFVDEKKFPLRLCYCEQCHLVQVVDVVAADVLFSNYFYYSSVIRTLREHFSDYATEVTSRFLDNPQSATVVEFGCNDGVLLIPLANQEIKNVIGVDPAANILQAIKDPRVNIVNDFFTEDTAAKIEQKFGKADLICANNVYAHIPDINGVTQAVTNLLADNGVFIFEVHYLGKIINDYQYDMVYHEHLYYYSLLALQKHFSRFDMTVFDIKPVAIHAGSMRYYVAKKSSIHAQNISPRVEQLAQEERDKGFDKFETFHKFAADIESRKNKLMELLEHLKEKGRSIVGYGASGRANTIIQYCGITKDHLDYMIDDSPAKHGYYTPGSHFLIRPKEALQQDQPDYTLIFAWSFFNEIADKNVSYLNDGGKMLVPLPDVRMIIHPDIKHDTL